MKISPAHDVAAILLHKNQRIIRSAIEFDKGHLARLGERITHRTVDLRSAAQAIRVLDAGVLVRGAVRFADLAALIETSEIARGGGGAGISAGLHDARIERAGTTAKSIE